MSIRGRIIFHKFLNIFLFGIGACSFAIWPLSVKAEAERLYAFARMKAVEGRIVNQAIASQVDEAAKSIGFSENTPSTSEWSVQPTLGFDANINGGNSPDPLVIGSLIFESDPAEQRKSGIVAGVNMAQSMRYFYGYGKYLNVSLDAEHVRSVQHDLEVNSANLNACLNNHITDWWFIDFCADTNYVNRKLVQTRRSNQSIIWSKIFEDSNRGYSQISLGAARYNTASYSQNQLILGLDTIGRDGDYVALELVLGEPLADTLSTKVKISTQLSSKFGNQPYSLSAAYEKADGGLFFGSDRNDQTYSVIASFPVFTGVSASFGYTHTDSTVDYFDTSSPTFGLSFEQFRF